MKMDISPEELKKEILKRKKEEIERQRWNQLQERYREQIANGELKINLNWIDKDENWDLNYLQATFDVDFYNDLTENFTTTHFNLDRILNFHCETEEEANRVYPKNNLWDTDRQNWKITNLIYHLESKPVSPPVIDISDSDILLFYDGNHRVALARFLGLKEIPFIVRRDNIERLKQL